MDIDCWVAEDHPEPGVALSAKVLAALAESVAMIVLLTESAHSSPYVHQEIGVAVAARMPVIALVDTGLSSSALAMLEGIEYISLDPDDLASSSANLIAGLRRVGERAGVQSVTAGALPQPVFQFQLSAQVQLTGGQLLVGLLIVGAIVGLIFVAAQANSGAAGSGAGTPAG